MPRGYVGGVEYVGFGKYKCPDCGITKVKNAFVSRRKGEVTMSMSRCNSCEYHRYAKGYYQRVKAVDPERRKRLYDESPEAQRSRERAAIQSRMEEEIAELGISDEEIRELTGMRRSRIKAALSPGARWSWSLIQEFMYAIDKYRDPLSESSGESGDSELPTVDILSEQPI